MKKLKDFLVNSRRAIVWTIFYCLVMWSILRYLFNFDMLRTENWGKLLTVELHGFGGLVFGILILAAVPLYVATTVLTVRNKSMPIKIPCPACLAPKPKPAEEPAPAPLVVEQDVLPELPHGVPAEMRDSFMRARKQYGARQQSVFNRVGGTATKPEEKKPEIEIPKTKDAPIYDSESVVFHDLQMENTEKVSEHIVENVSGVVTDENPDFPIPKDFDVSGTDTTDHSVPVFSDINFDDDNEGDNDTDESEMSPDAVCKMLNAAGVKSEQDGDLIKTDKCVIAVHDDDDFWVADETDWFAPGKSRPSPIAKLKSAHDADELKPILYLACDNIMDLDKLIPEWQSDGITVVKSSDELMKVVG